MTTTTTITTQSTRENRPFMHGSTTLAVKSIKSSRQRRNLLVNTQYAIPAWLGENLSTEAVCNGLRRYTSEFADGQLTIVDCDIKRLRLREKELCWSGVCLLTVSDGADDAPRTHALKCDLLPPKGPQPTDTGAQHPFGSPAWYCYLPELSLLLSMQPEQTKLAALTELTDPEAARALLEEAIRSGDNPAYHDLRIDACRPQIMRYKPGSRCTILYHLLYAPAFADRGWPTVVVAKTHHGDKGKVAYDGMVALWHSAMRTSGAVTLAEPLAYLPTSRVLVQGPIREEMTLKDLIQEALDNAGNGHKSAQHDELYDYLRKTAIGLAELHRCGAYCGEVVTLADEMTEIYEDRMALASVLPQFADFADPLLDTLRQVAINHPADPLVPAHRSFRPAQVLLNQGDIGFIDFDGFCQAEPAMDLALFMTTMKNMARVKEHSPADADQCAELKLAESLCDFFLTEYEKHAPISRPRIMLWESVQLLALLLGSWKKLKLDRLPYCYLLLQRHVERHGLGSGQ